MSRRAAMLVHRSQGVYSDAHLPNQPSPGQQLFMEPWLRGKVHSPMPAGKEETERYLNIREGKMRTEEPQIILNSI